LKLAVECSYIGSGVEAQSDASLVTDDDDSDSGAIHASNGFNDSWKQFEFAPLKNEMPFGCLLIQHAIAVQEDGVYAARKDTI